MNRKIDIVKLIIILVVLNILVLIFKEQLTEFVADIMFRITELQ